MYICNAGGRPKGASRSFYKYNNEIMKKLLLVLFTFISLNVFAQLQIKEGSFKHIPNGVIEDKGEYVDSKGSPMALIKISTENINEQERLRLVFEVNKQAQIIKKPKTGQIWVYLSAEASDYLKIKHETYGECKLEFKEKLCEYCVYDVSVQYIPKEYVTEVKPVKENKAHLIIKTDQPNALIYIDGEPVGTHEVSELLVVGTTHDWKIECDMYHTEYGTLTINSRLEIVKKLRPAYGYIYVKTTPETGASVFVDGKYVGVSPCKTDKLSSGTHNVRVVKDLYKMTEKSYVVTDDQTTNVNIEMEVNYVAVTIKTESQSDIYVDDVYKGRGVWNGRLPDGSHVFEARKNNHKTSSKSVELVIGKDKTINIDAPTPINGILEISSDPMGAKIFIDGKSYGNTPNYLDVLIGQHELKLVMDGCVELKKKITIEEGKVLKLNEELQTGGTVYFDNSSYGVDKHQVSTSPVYGSVNIKTFPKDVSVYIDGEYYGKTPCNVKSLLVGNHEIMLTKHGYVELKKNIYVEKNQTYELSETLQEGKKIKIESDKIGDMVYIDKQHVGSTPVSISLAYGIHTIKIQRGQYSMEETFDVQSETSIISLIFGKKVKVISDKVGDVVFIDGAEMGLTPCELKMTYGSHNIEIVRGSYRHKETYNLERSSNVNEIRFTLGEEVVINTAEKGDKIYVDGEYVGKSPYKGYMFYGIRKIKIKRDNEVVEKQINVTKGYGQNVFYLYMGQKIKFESSKKRTVLFVDGDRVGRTPLEIDVPYGNHVFRVRRFNKWETRKEYIYPDKSIITFNPKRENLRGFIDNGVRFFTVNASSSYTNQLSYGISWGSFRKVGWYMSVMTNFDMIDSKYYTGLNQFIPPYFNDDYIGDYQIDENISFDSRLSAAAGLMFKICGPVYLKTGVAYGFYSKYYSTTDNIWVKSPYESFEDLMLNMGLQFNMKRLVISAEVLTTKDVNSIMEFKVGIGYGWKKRK